ncbi:MAG: hypothetical protein EOP50_00190 [Sphingobacteriales bacterium]|nr:MAG: hypothetical protein EOP50_00190 [Sphingobacteriales bacterium]
MTTRKKADDWGDDGFPPPPPTPEESFWFDPLRDLLAPYSPAESVKEADVFYSTHDLIAALDQHFATLQGALVFEVREPIDAKLFVEGVQKLGFRAVNTGGLTMQWILKRRPEN